MSVEKSVTLPLSAALMLIFSFGYLLSSLLRGVTASIAPIFTLQFGISPTELGLLAGSYFASFALLQLPMGALLDRYGVRKVLVLSLAIAAVSCLLFASASSFSGLFGARLLSGIGVSACLIAPLTAARLWAPPAQQQRINSWMLMAGALGLVLGTLPSEAVATGYGWRFLFIGLGLLFLLAAVLILVAAPRNGALSNGDRPLLAGYGRIILTPYTWKIGALGMLNYAILVAVQTLWIGPWLTTLREESARSASLSLLYINTFMLIVFLVMGWLSPKISKSPEDAEGLLRRWTPVSAAMLVVVAVLGAKADWYLFALYCVVAWPLSVTHPLVGQRAKPEEAGRAIAFFNLLLFVGVFLWQWSFGIIIARLTPLVGIEGAYQVAMASLAALSILGYGTFIFVPCADSQQKPNAE